MSIKDLWISIEESGAPGFIARRLSPESSHPLHIAVDTTQGSRLLVLECRTPPSSSVLSALYSTNGYIARYVKLDISTSPKKCIILESTPETPFDVFESLCEDVAEAVITRRPDDDPEDIFAGRLMLWKRLFEAGGAGGLPFHERLGLLSEIIFMSELIFAGGSPSDVVAWWAGPDKLTSDFQSPHGRVEVKSTATRKQYKIRIHGERQLEPQQDRPIHLVVMILEKVVADGTTLPKQVHSLRTLLGNGSAVQSFNAKLLQVGYLSIHEDSYQSDEFRLLEKREYRIDDNFPRITSAAVPDGVGDLEYSLDLSACEPFRISEGTATKTLLNR